MNTRLLSRLAVFALVVLVLASVLTAAAAANIVPTTHNTNQTRAFTANDLKPALCPYNLTNIFFCSKKNCKATGANELVLGSPDINKIDGGGGNDCCVGAPGNTFSNCEWHN